MAENNDQQSTPNNDDQVNQLIVQVNTQIGELTKASNGISTHIDKLKKTNIDEVAKKISELETYVFVETKNEINNNATKWEQVIDQSFQALLQSLEEELHQGGLDAIQEVIEAAGEFVENIDSEITDKMESLFADWLDRVQEGFADVVEEKVGNFNETIENTLETSVEKQTQMQEALEKAVEDHVGRIKAHFEQNVQGLLEEEVNALVNDVVEEILEGLAEDLALTQISGMVTSALSPIMPQLVTLKISADAIKEALNLMRTGSG